MRWAAQQQVRSARLSPSRPLSPPQSLSRSLTLSGTLSLTLSLSLSHSLTHALYSRPSLTPASPGDPRPGCSEPPQPPQPASRRSGRGSVGPGPSAAGIDEGRTAISPLPAPFYMGCSSGPPRTAVQNESAALIQARGARLRDRMMHQACHWQQMRLRQGGPSAIASRSPRLPHRNQALMTLAMERQNLFPQKFWAESCVMTSHTIT